jgi:hypothetical protein
VLADEINRAPPKTQAALLEAMGHPGFDEERPVIDRDTVAELQAMRDRLGRRQTPRLRGRTRTSDSTDAPPSPTEDTAGISAVARTAAITQATTGPTDPYSRADPAPLPSDGSSAPLMYQTGRKAT